MCVSLVVNVIFVSSSVVYIEFVRFILLVLEIEKRVRKITINGLEEEFIPIGSRCLGVLRVRVHCCVMLGLISK